MKKLQGCIGIIARLGSKRLKDKQLRKVNKRPIIGYLINRIKKEFYLEISKKQLEIYILTGNEKFNKRFSKIAFEYGISVYFGHDVNIPMRMFDLVTNKKFDFIIVVEADDVLCAPEGMRKVYDSILADNQYVKTIDYPFGMNSMGATKAFLANSLKGKEDRILENGYGWIFDENKCKQISMNLGIDERLRFSLDYPEDLSFFKKILLSDLDIVNAKTEDIINYVVKKEIYLENTHLFKEYWERFRISQLLEMQGDNSG